MQLESDPAAQPSKANFLKHWSLANLVAAGVLVGLGVITVLALFWRPATGPNVVISPDELKGVGFAVYLPRHLPAGYHLDTGTFRFVPSQQVFVFSAKDGTGDVVAFSEQSKPGVDFAQIYQKLFVNSSNLADMPYPSTMGSTLDRQTTLLSVVTPGTWIMATTKADLGQQDLSTIASSLYSYKR